MRVCEIKIENGTPVVKTYPSLMQDILEFTEFDTEQALDLYGVVLTDEFIDMNIENPTLKKVTSFIEQDNINNSGKLTKEDRNNLLNLSVQREYMNDIKERFINAFNVEGEFGIDMVQLMESGLFKERDVMNMNSSENIEKIKKLYYKLNNTDEKFESITSNINVKSDLFDKLNPDQFLQNSYNFYINAQTKNDVLNIANEVGDDLILDNPELAEEILKAVNNKQSFVQYETDMLTGQVVRKQANDTAVRLTQTLDTNQDFSGFMEQIDFLRTLPIESYVEDLEVIQSYISNIETQAQDLGLDLSGLAITIEDSTYSDTLDYLDSLYNFLSDINDTSIQELTDYTISSMQETIPEYAEAHNSYFKLEPQPTKTTLDRVKGNGVYLHVESNLSEEDLFKANSILKVRDNIYQKITDDKSLSELYDLIFLNPNVLPKNTLSVSVTELNRDLIYEEIDQYISDLAKENLTEYSDIEAVKKIEVYKMLNNIQNDMSTTELNGLDKMNIDKFLVDFNKLSLKNPTVRDYFYYSNRGLEANQVIGEYSAREIKNSISESDFDNLVLYSKLSGNESLQYFTNYNNDISSENKRDYYANNMNQLKAFDGNYYENQGFVVANTQQDFIKIKNRLYEQVASNVYAEVERNDRYLNYNLPKPKYNNSVTPLINGQQSTRVKVAKTKNIQDNNIEFC